MKFKNTQIETVAITNWPNLRTKLLVTKKKIQNSIKKLAFDLIQLQAKRALAKAHSFSPPNHLFEEFELAFPFFNETPDQSRPSTEF